MKGNLHCLFFAVETRNDNFNQGLPLGSRRNKDTEPLSPEQSNTFMLDFIQTKLKWICDDL